jgi:hypothetical protein
MAQLLTTSAMASLLAFALVSCTSDPASSTSTATVDDVSSKLVSDLNIIAPQSDSVRNAFHRHGIDNPAALWTLAAELETTLTAEQKARLLSMQPPTPHGEFPDSMGMRDGCRGDSSHPGRPGMGPHPDGPPSQAMLDSEFAAMTRALGLSESQQGAMKDLFESQRAAMDSLMEKIKAGTIDPATAHDAMDQLHQDRDTALAAILDSTQLEIFKIHEALMMRMGPPGGPGHGPGPHRR